MNQVMKQASLRVVLAALIVVVITMGQGIVLPILPMVVFQHNLLLNGVSSTYPMEIYGAVMALWALAVFLGGPFLGRLSDRIGREKALLVTTGLTCIGYGLSVWAILLKSLWLFLIARFICGYFSATYDIVQALAMDMSQPKQKAVYLGWLSVATSLGFVFGPMLLSLAMSGNWMHLGLATPFLLASVVSVLSLLMSVVLLWHRMPKACILRGALQRHMLWHMLLYCKMLFCDERLRRIAIGLFLLQMGWALFVLAMPIFLKAQFQFNDSMIGLYFTVMGLSSFVGVLALSIKILPVPQWRYGYVTSAVLMSVVLVQMLFFPNVMVLWLTTIIGGALNLLAYSFGSALLSEAVVVQEQGGVMGLNGAIFGLAWFLAAFLMFMMSTHTMTWFMGLGFFVILLSGLVILWPQTRKNAGFPFVS